MVIIGGIILLLCFGWKILCAIGDGICWLFNWLCSVICCICSWLWLVVLKLLAIMLAPSIFVAEIIGDGSGFSWCIGIAVELILIGFIIGMISRFRK